MCWVDDRGECSRGPTAPVGPGMDPDGVCGNDALSDVAEEGRAWARDALDFWLADDGAGDGEPPGGIAIKDWERGGARAGEVCDAAPCRTGVSRDCDLGGRNGTVIGEWYGEPSLSRRDRACVELKRGKKRSRTRSYRSMSTRSGTHKMMRSTFVQV